MCVLFFSLISVAVVISRPAGPSSAFAATKSLPMNIVLILTDDQTFESVAKMPYVSRRVSWITFSKAFISDPLCCPSRAAILSGQYDFHNRVRSNQIGDTRRFDSQRALPKWLRDAGYTTGLFGKYLNQYPFDGGTGHPPGWDAWSAFDKNMTYYSYNLLDQNRSVEHFGETPDAYSTDVFAAKAVDFVSTAREPFFLYFAPFAPHAPFTPAPRHQRMFAGARVDHSPNFNEPDISDKPLWIRERPVMNVTDINRKIRQGWATLQAVDDAVRAIFEALARRNSVGVLDHTVVVIMTDNGLSLGAHRWGGKSCIYEECIHTPMLVYYPGQPARIIDRLVSNVDIAPTFAEIAQATPNIRIDGRSFLPLLTGGAQAPWRTGVLLHFIGGTTDGDEEDDSEVPGFWAIRTDTYKYAELSTGERELYDLAHDPYELQNQAGNPDFANIIGGPGLGGLADQLTALRNRPLPGN
jgi:arylsulfatase A-like enzyme